MAKRTTTKVLPYEALSTINKKFIKFLDEFYDGYKRRFAQRLTPHKHLDYLPDDELSLENSLANTLRYNQYNVTTPMITLAKHLHPELNVNYFFDYNIKPEEIDKMRIKSESNQDVSEIKEILVRLESRLTDE